jgi:hypothetical protein
MARVDLGLGIDAAGQVAIRRQLKRRFVMSFFEKLNRNRSNS